MDNLHLPKELQKWLKGHVCHEGSDIEKIAFESGYRVQVFSVSDFT